MKAQGAPIDGFGIGVNLDASIDAPSLDCAYKLQEYAGTPRRKLSEGKQTWPGRKQVWRAYDAQGRMRGDVLSLETDRQAGETLIEQVMRGGKRLAPAPTLAQIRARAARRTGAFAGAAAAVGSVRLSGDDFGSAEGAGGGGRRQDAPLTHLRHGRAYAGHDSRENCYRSYCVPALFQPRAPSP